MAGNEKPKKENSRGRTKAANRAGTQTARNKARAAETRQRRHEAAQRRRDSGVYVVPMDAMIEISSLPKTARAKLLEEFPYDVDEHGKPIMIPDPKRGMKSQKGLSKILAKRTDQTRRIEGKRQQRHNFSSLKPAEKREHRAAGMEHRLPR